MFRKQLTAANLGPRASQPVILDYDDNIPQPSRPSLTLLLALGPMHGHCYQGPLIRGFNVWFRVGGVSGNVGFD